jgi:hypothetical protein
MNLTLVTPDLAKQMLTKNHCNRIVKPDTVTQYAADILAEKWKPNKAEPIAVSYQGNLLNGQHRLHAVIKANKPQYFYIVEEDESIMSVLDTGRGRTAGDVLRIFGIDNNNNVAAAIRMWHKLNVGYLSTNSRHSITNSDVLSEYKRRPSFWHDIVNKSQRLYKGSLLIVNKSIISGMLAYWSDKGQPTTFVEAVLQNDHSVLNAAGLNKYLTNVKIRRKLMSQTETVLIFFKYHNLWQQNKKAGQFKISIEEDVKMF